MKKVCVLSAVLMSLAFVGISDVSAAPNWFQMQKQNASTAIVKRQYDSLKNDIAKQEQEVAKQEQELAVKKAKLVELEKKLGTALSAQTTMQQQRTAAAAAKAQAKENARVASVNQKANADVQKAELEALQAQLKALQAQYEGKVDIALPGVKNMIKRNQEKAKFTKRANDLIKAGTDFATIKATLISEFGLS